jgi:hypothetical protein
MTIDLSTKLRGGILTIASGGTGSATAPDALTALGAQAVLVAGNNIKTVNGTTILGPGNLVVTGGLAPTAIKINNGYTAVADDLVRCNTTSGAFSISFPTSPTDGTIIGVVDVASTFGTNHLTIDRGGTTTIEGDTSYILDISGTYVSFVYNTATTNWRLLETPTAIATGYPINTSSLTNITGLIKGNGSLISAAESGTDYVAPPSGTSLLKANSGGALANALAGTDYVAPPSGTSLLKANSGGALANALAGTDYIAPSGALGTPSSGNLSSCSNLSLTTGVTGTLPVLNGGTGVTTSTGSGNNVLSTSPTLTTTVLTSYSSIQALFETATVSASAPIATTNFDIISQAVQYYTANTTVNFTLNIRGNSLTSLNTIMTVAQSATIALIVTNSTSAFYPNVIQIDGTAQTIKWQNGLAVTAGNVSSLDVYTFTIIKTAANTYIVLGSQTKFA